MHPHPLIRPLVIATVMVAFTAVLLLGLARRFGTELEGMPLALLEAAANIPEDSRVLWVDSGDAGSDAGRLRGQVAKALEVTRRAGARAVLLALPLEQSSDSADLARVRSFLDGADASPDVAMRARLTGWASELDHDAELERAIRAAGNVVLIASASAAPLERFATAAHGTGIEPTLAPDADGVARSDALLVTDGSAAGAPSATLAAWLAAHGLGRAALRPVSGGVLAGTTLLHTGSGTRWIPLYGRRAGEDGGTVRLSLDDLAGGRVVAAALEHRTLVIGRGGAALTTPTGAGLSEGEALAQRIASLEAGDYLVYPGYASALEVLLLLLAIVYAAAIAPRLSTPVRAAVTLLLGLALLALEFVLLAAASIWIPCLVAAISLLLATFAVWVVPEPRTAPAMLAGRIAPLTAPPRRPATQVAARKPSAASDPRPAPGGRPTLVPEPLGTSAPASLREISESLEARREDRSRAEVADLLLGRSKRPPKPKLGRYELDRELGRGAMGTVYLGRDPRINRVVAIKAIPIVEEFSEEDLAEARARFFREAEMAGRLKHPGIVTVHDAGEDGGIAWIAMEYVGGHLLSEHVASDRLLPPKTVLELAARVADALDYAHAQDVIHRDIKPGNIMFDPATLETKITDFGIARLTNSSATRTGIVLGTPSFMAPEQLEGRNVTGRSDLFALGVTLFQLLAGQLPFRADSMTGLMDKIANAPHPPLNTIRPDLAPCVSEIVDRALQKNPADRFATAGDLARAIRACAASAEV